jgi:predicted small secreted protein
MRKRFVILLGLLLLGGLVGCETMKGMGRDVEKAGAAIQRAAK